MDMETCYSSGDVHAPLNINVKFNKLNLNCTVITFLTLYTFYNNVIDLYGHGLAIVTPLSMYPNSIQVCIHFTCSNVFKYRLRQRWSCVYAWCLLVVNDNASGHKQMDILIKGERRRIQLYNLLTTTPIILSRHTWLDMYQPRPQSVTCRYVHPAGTTTVTTFDRGIPSGEFARCAKTVVTKTLTMTKATRQYRDILLMVSIQWYTNSMSTTLIQCQPFDIYGV
jgi:hypothetical protein